MQVILLLYCGAALPNKQRGKQWTYAVYRVHQQSWFSARRGHLWYVASSSLSPCHRSNKKSDPSSPEFCPAQIMQHKAAPGVVLHLDFLKKCRGTPSQGVRIGYKNTSACIDTPVTAQVLKLNPLSHQQRQKAPFSIVKKKKEKKNQIFTAYSPQPWQQTCGKAK